MIIINEKGDEVYLFSTVKEVEDYLEAIDIENNEYDACDDEGFIYKFKLIRPPGTFDPGQFRIVKTDQKDINLPRQYFMNYGKKFSKSEQELDLIYKSFPCASEAIRSLQTIKVEHKGFFQRIKTKFKNLWRK